MDVNIEGIEDLRLFASYYIEATDMDSEDKVKLINFVKESSEDQIGYLMIKGRMEIDPVILKEENFLSIMYQGLKGIYDMSGGGVEGAVNAARASAPVAVPVAAFVAAAVFAATKIYKNFLGKAAKACSNKKGESKKKCMQKFKIDGMKERITNLNKAKSQCNKSKNPSKCTSDIDAKITKLKKYV